MFRIGAKKEREMTLEPILILEAVLLGDGFYFSTGKLFQVGWLVGWLADGLKTAGLESQLATYSYKCRLL